MEQLIEVKAFRSVYLCDTCGTEMEWNGVCYTSNPPLYPHVCPKCFATRTFSTHYPTIVYRSEKEIKETDNKSGSNS